VASGEVAATLGSAGIPWRKISVTGIPIGSAFSRRRSRAALRRRLDLSQNRPVVLVMSGAAGGGSITDSGKRILARGDVQVLAACGRNEKARRSLNAMRPPRGSRLVVYGFVEDIASLMAAADLFVGKSGGLTTAECLAMRLPMVVFDPIPGQEERNCD